MKESCNFLCLQDFIEIYRMQIKPLKFYGLISAIKDHYYKNFPKGLSTQFRLNQTRSLTRFLKALKVIKGLLQETFFFRSNTPEKSQLKWNTLFSQEGCMYR